MWPHTLQLVRLRKSRISVKTRRVVLRGCFAHVSSDGGRSWILDGVGPGPVDSTLLEVQIMEKNSFALANLDPIATMLLDLLHEASAFKGAICVLLVVGLLSVLMVRNKQSGAPFPPGPAGLPVIGNLLDLPGKEG